MRSFFGIFFPLAIWAGGFYSSNLFVFLIPVLAQIFMVLTPPFYGGAILVISVGTAVIYMTLGVCTLAMKYSFDHPGEIWPSYVTLVVFWVIALPPLKSSKSAVGSTCVMIVVLGACYLYLETFGLVIYGELYGIDTSGLDLLGDDPLGRFCNRTVGEGSLVSATPTPFFSPSLLLPKLDIPALLASLVCRLPDPVRATLVQTLVASIGGRACVPFSIWGALLRHEIELFAPQSIWLYDLFASDAPDLCLSRVDGQEVWMVSMTPGQWIISVIWSGGDHNLAMAEHLYAMFAIAICCCAFARLLPPGRLAVDELRSMLSEECAGLRRSLEQSALLSSLPAPSGLPSKVLTDVDAKYEVLTSLGSLSMLEPSMRHPGATVWPALLKGVIPAARGVAEAISFAELVAAAVVAAQPAPAVPNAALVEGLRQAELACLAASARALQYKPLIALASKDESAQLCEELGARADDVRAASEALQSPADVEAHVADKSSMWYAASEAKLADATIAMSSACSSLLTAQSHPSAKGALLGVLGLALPGALPFVEILKFWLLMPVHVASAVWRGELAWWRDYRLHVSIRAMLAFPGMLALVAFVPEVRDYLMTPVGPLPYGALGQWLLLPTVLVLLHTVDGSFGKGLLRIGGTALGAALGFAAGTALRELDTPWVACLVFVLVNFVCTFVGVDASGRFGASGMFNSQWGYAMMLTTYTTMILAIEGDELHLRYDQGQYTTIRLVGQLGGIAVAMVATLLIFPRFARPTICGLAAGSLRLMAAELSARGSSPPPPPKKLPKAGKQTATATASFAELRERIGPLLPETLMLLEEPTNDPALEVVRLMNEVELSMRTFLEADDTIHERGEKDEAEASGREGATASQGRTDSEKASADACAALLEWTASRINNLQARGRSICGWLHLLKFVHAAPAAVADGETLLQALAMAAKVALSETDELARVRAQVALLATYAAVRQTMPTLLGPVIGEKSSQAVEVEVSRA